MTHWLTIALFCLIPLIGSADDEHTLFDQQEEDANFNRFNYPSLKENGYEDTARIDRDR